MVPEGAENLEGRETHRALTQAATSAVLLPQAKVQGPDL